MTLISKLCFWKSNEIIPEPTRIHEQGSFSVYVDADPIGGYRGKIGTLSIKHNSSKLFTDFNKGELINLAVITNKVLSIFESFDITNTLIYGKQENNTFKLSFIPYPKKCTLFEKIQGAWHVIFGSPTLKSSQMNAIVKELNNKDLWTAIKKEEKNEQEEIENNHPLSPKIDFFCKNEVLNKQKIVDLQVGNKENFSSISILHDNRPKGPHHNDPHFLIVPQGESGHVDGSAVPILQRWHLLQTAQKIMDRLVEKGNFSSFVYVERNGEELRGVPHLHDHVMGIESFPKTVWQKISALFRLMWPSKLSDAKLQERISTYKLLLTK